MTKKSRLFATLAIGFGVSVLWFTSQQGPNPVPAVTEQTSTSVDEGTVGPLAQLGQSSAEGIVTVGPQLAATNTDSVVQPNVHSSLVDTQFYMGLRMRTDVRSLYFDNLEEADSGVADKMVAVAQAIRSCLWPSVIGGPEGVSGAQKVAFEWAEAGRFSFDQLDRISLNIEEWNGKTFPDIHLHSL